MGCYPFRLLGALRQQATQSAGPREKQVSAIAAGQRSVTAKDTLCFSCGSPDKTLTRLRKEGFAEQASGTHEGWYAAHDATTPTDDAATPQEALWTVLEGRLKAIVGSGTLDALVS